MRCLATLCPSFLGIIAYGTLWVFREMGEAIMYSLRGDMIPLPLDVTLKSLVRQPACAQKRDQA